MGQQSLSSLMILRNIDENTKLRDMNRIIKTIALVMMTAMLAACVKDPSTDPEPEPMPTPDPFENARFSILGDSYSTFTGHVSPATNDIWPYYYQIGVTSVE